MSEHHHLDRRSLLLAGAGVTTSAAVLTFEPAQAGRSVTKTFHGEFTDPNTPDWHYLPFTVPKGVRSIEVSYDYTPTDLGPISINVVDIGIFDPSGYALGDAQGFRGWSGGARRRFELSRGWATPGYLPGPITPGAWRIALGPYQISFGGTPWKVRVTLHFGEPGPRFTPHPAPRRVEGTGPGWYRGDMHVHTVNSDGARNEPQMMKAALAAGLDFLGSSDHNTSSATLKWGRHTPADFLLMSGEEVTTRNGHWLAVGLPAGTWIDWRYRAEDDQLGRFADQVRALGGMAIVAHPFTPVPSIKWDFGYDYAHMDAIEVWNGPWTGDDQTAVEHWNTALVDGTYLPVVGNSDSHNDSQTVGLAQTVVRADNLGTAAIVAALRGGHAWIAESSAVGLTFVATLGEATAECGDRLEAAPGDTVDVRLEVTGVPGTLAQLRGPEGVIAGALADDGGTIVLTAQVPAGGTPFVRAEVRRPSGEVNSPVDDMAGEQMVALTNPIFISAP
jgi:predicted metal-dependent phosphoesterase TrpH